MTQIEKITAAYSEEVKGATTPEERVAAMERAAAKVRDREEAPSVFDRKASK